MKLQTEINIREWTKSDFSIVKNILLTTWKDTYSFIPIKDIEKYFYEFYSDDRLKEILIDPFSSGILAEVNSKSVGWMKLFDNYVEKKLFVSSLYVLPKFQGFGIGKKLLNHAYSIAEQKKYNKVWLGVMKQNTKSLEWYIKLGFEFVKEEPFQMGSTSVTHLIGYKNIS
ncbi:MAG: GNAT family N-acetyltransferase [Ignavibacteriota bacterium]|nr:GNAT family N-acetyltransferase [Ignavibacteriota bacterium]MCO6446961.1 GNAT family N-acetyltransferase [Ignavibacterium album]MCZ2267587.1 GNAT family N-acetyltransferase [Ignavibacteriales bacterium]QKJ99496.1 MAG: GNAT family N-acetyltransferase [Ignavibacteriota bacterium]HOJ06905.1 GNAT family N-acetyltransferase [Ignavibacteriaceae bacterium]